MSKEQLLEIVVIRHAQKGADGQLTDEGKAEAFAFGESIAHRGTPKIYTSDIQRAVDTGALITAATGSSLAPRIRGFLSESPYTDERLSELNLDEGRWLLLNDVYKDLPNTMVIAGKLAKFILGQKEIASRAGCSSDRLAITVTHVPTIMCFTGHVLAKDMEKASIDQDVVTKLQTIMGGRFVPPLKGFKVIIAEGVDSVFVMGDYRSVLGKDFLEQLQNSHDEWVKINEQPIA